MATRLLDALGQVWPYLVGLAGAGWGLLQFILNRGKESRKERADLAEIARKAAAEQLGGLRDQLKQQSDEIKGLRGRLKAAEDEISTLQRDQVKMLTQHAQTMLDKDATLSMLRARCRQLEQDAVSMRDLMRRNGIDPPPIPPPIYDIPKGSGQDVP